MRCPSCGAKTKVEAGATKLIADGKEVERTRVCTGSVHHRFVTYERPQVGSVRKQHGAIEDFDRFKLERGLLVAINKRPVERGRVTAFVDQISAEVAAAGVLETRYIGERALEFLGTLDDVAYIRFISVYREFGSVTQFRDELTLLRPSLQVHKRRGGGLEPFSRTKLLNGLLRAASRRDELEFASLLTIVDEISASAAPRQVISSREIGRQVMERLRDLDDVAYIRFASVYHSFDSAEDFLGTLGELGRGRGRGRGTRARRRVA